MKNILRNSFLVLLTSLLLTGCGNGTNNSNSSSSHIDYPSDITTSDTPSEDTSIPSETTTEVNKGPKYGLDLLSSLQINIENIDGYGIGKLNQKQKAVRCRYNANEGSSETSSETTSPDTTTMPEENIEEPDDKFYLYGSTPIYEENGIDIKDNKIVKITFKKSEKVLEPIYDEDGNEIGTEEVIKQSDIDGQLNKMYIQGHYMFMQFIASDLEEDSYGIELRPNNLYYDENGFNEFDVFDYFTDNGSLSFISDLNTGLIYEINGIRIKQICKGNILNAYDAVNDATGYFKYDVIDDNLVFTDVMPNKDVEVYSALRDKYDWCHVMNDSIDFIDNENKVLYCREDRMLSDDGTIYLFDKKDEYANYKFIDGKKVEIDPQETVEHLYNWRAPEENYGLYKGKRFIGTRIQDSLTIDYNYDKIKRVFFTGKHLDYLVYVENNAVYYKYIDKEKYYNTNTYIIDLPTDAVKLYEGSVEYLKYYQVEGNKYNGIHNVIRVTTPLKTTYNHFVEENNELKFVELYNTEYFQNTVTLQPINK